MCDVVAWASITSTTSQATWVEVLANGMIISKKVHVGREGGGVAE